MYGKEQQGIPDIHLSDQPAAGFQDTVFLGKTGEESILIWQAPAGICRLHQATLRPEFSRGNSGGNAVSGGATWMTNGDSSGFPWRADCCVKKRRTPSKDNLSRTLAKAARTRAGTWSLVPVKAIC